MSHARENEEETPRDCGMSSHKCCHTTALQIFSRDKVPVTIMANAMMINTGLLDMKCKHPGNVPTCINAVVCILLQASITSTVKPVMRGHMTGCLNFVLTKLCF